MDICSVARLAKEAYKSQALHQAGPNNPMKQRGVAFITKINPK